jgi:hypothetical protein
MALKKTHRDFRAAYAMSEGKSLLIRHLDAMWWYMENVSPEDTARNDIYWELRRQRAALLPPLPQEN